MHQDQMILLKYTVYVDSVGRTSFEILSDVKSMDRNALN